MKAWVTSSREMPKDYLLTALSDHGWYNLFSYKEFKPGTYVEFSGKEKRIDEDTIEVKIDEISEIHEVELEEKVEAYLKTRCKIRKVTKPLVKGPLMGKLSKLFDETAYLIKRAKFLRQPIIVRYDHDPDGLTGALALYKVLANAVHLHVIPSHWPMYKESDVDDDLRYLSSLEADHLPPLLLILDMGSNPESFEAYELARELKFTTVVFDHHQWQDKSIVDRVDVLVSAWHFGDGKSYTTGILTSEVVVRLEDLDMMRFAEISMAADRSDLTTPSEESLKAVDALAYMIKTSKFPKTIEHFSKVFNDKEMLDVVFAQADARMGEVLGEIEKKIKTKTLGNITAFIIDISRIVKTGTYPGATVISNTVSDMYSEKLKTPSITLAYRGRTISMRSNKAGIKAGINLGDVAKELKVEIPQFIEGGGGHAPAAAIRMKLGSINQVIKHILAEVESQTAKK